MKRRTFASCLLALLLMTSVGSTAARISKPTRDWGCWFVFTPDEELIVVCGDIPPPQNP